MHNETAWSSRRRCAILTAEARLTGSLRTKRRRLVDALHEMHEPLVVLHEATMEQLSDLTSPPRVFPTALVRLSDVVVCYPLEPAGVPYRRSRAAAGIREEQIISHVVLQANGVTVPGDAHLPIDTTFMGYVTSRSNAFLPMTGVTVTWGTGATSVPDALVNCELVSAFYTHTESLAFMLGHDGPASDTRRSPAAVKTHAERVWIPSTFNQPVSVEGVTAAL